MSDAFKNHLTEQIGEIRKSGLYKDERIITSPQSSRITVAGGREVLNMCANNYLGLAAHPEVYGPRGRASTIGATACHRCGSSAAPSRSTRTWRGR
jgi:glycine C-acetyltransferase